MKRPRVSLLRTASVFEAETVARRAKLMVPGALLTLLAGGCATGGDAGTAATTTSATPITSAPTTSPNVFEADLTITIGTGDQPVEFEATLRCGSDVGGTGYLAGRAAGACDSLKTSADAQLLLLMGPAADRACTEIYGGGEIADIKGTLTGIAVDMSVDRANGCGISDWDLLQPILVEPYDLARQNAAGDCSGAAAPTGDSADQVNLPPLVADVRTALLNGAASCDLEGLASRAIGDDTNVSFGGSDDPAALWRDLEASGATPMADLVAVLQLAVGTIDDGQGTVFYVWPAVAALDDWSDATEEQRSELAALFGADALDSWDAFGGYIGYRVGIADTGRWAFFVEGD